MPDTYISFLAQRDAQVSFMVEPYTDPSNRNWATGGEFTVWPDGERSSWCP